uniref:Carboxypeptidase n=1 Tax=Megaselia scalaris TaxID=36166 RepID=T1GJZ0_MEGSC
MRDANYGEVVKRIKGKKNGFGPGKQDWGHVTVRKGAHMFYWLYYTTATPLHTRRPLAIWLQGGPGASSTGYGNFEELGPLTLELENRNWTWVKDMNVMFIDNPVGSGYSYVDAATNSWGATQRVLLTESKGVDFYDILKPVKGPNKARLFYNDFGENDEKNLGRV